MYFNIKGSILKKYIKQGILKDRVIPGEEKKVQLQLFLIKDNESILPPKHFLESRTVKVLKDEHEYYTQEFWYEFIDQDRFEQLKRYRIMDCLNETFAKPIETGRFLYKAINPIFGPLK